jgi:hypothetical protein
MTARSAQLLALLVVLAAPVVTSAQARVTPTARQIELNNVGLDAQEAGNHALAAEKFREALDAGELNLIYLNLGRALQKSGDCIGADKAYRAALSAPEIDQPAPAVIESTIADFRSEMSRECPGALVVTCDSDTVTVKISGHDWECNRPLSVAPGLVAVIATKGGETEARSVRVAALEGNSVDIRFGDSVVAAAPTATAPRGPSNSRDTAAITLFGAGGALMFTGVVFTFLTFQANDDIVDLAANAGEEGIDSIQATDAVARSRNYELGQFLSYGTGLALLGTAFTLYYWDGISETMFGATIQPAVTPDGAHVVIGFDY